MLEAWWWMSAKLTKVEEDTPRMLRRRSASTNWWSHQSRLWGTSTWSLLVTGSTRLTAQGAMGATPRQKRQACDILQGQLFFTHWTISG